jgi:hypothetical protein
VSAPWPLLPLLLGQAAGGPLADHVEEMSKVGGGRITGGWEYVWACYIIAWTGIALYALSLWLRRRGKKGSPA